MDLRISCCNEPEISLRFLKTLLEVRDVNLPQCFPEMRERENECKFNNCIHEHEPGCAIRAAVESGEIVATRYDSYLKMREDQKAQKPIYERENKT